MLDIAGIHKSLLPELMHSYEAAGRILPEMARTWAYPKIASC